MSQNKSIAIFQVDSFSDVPFKGNPAGVCVLEQPLDDSTMQNIAAEMNLSETAFAVPITAGPLKNAYKFNLRWFTPTVEVDLCGHATLATARVLYDIYEIQRDSLTFTTKSGDLIVNREEDLIQLDFPAGDPRPVELPEYFFNALNLCQYGLEDKFHEAFKCQRLGMILARFKDADSIRKIAPNFSDLLQAEDSFGSKGIVVTAEGEEPYDFISRFFAPCLGINEDPVTGAAHTVLAPYWSALLKKKIMTALQASKREGELTVEFREDPKGFRNRVLISGRAVIVLEGVMKLGIEEE